MRLINTTSKFSTTPKRSIWSVVMLTAVAVTGLSANMGAAQAQDATAGEAVFKKCRACHQVGAEAKAGVGPAQNNLVGRPAGTFEWYSYSALNKAAGEAGLVWTEENIFEYLADPNAFLKKFLTDKGKPDLATGSTKMVFKLADDQDRKDVIAYLKTQNGK
jgi:cytochrome c